MKLTEQALRLEPNDFGLVGNLALIRLLKGQTQEALTLFERAQAPEVASSRIAAIITDLGEVLDKNSNLAAAHYALGLLYEAKGGKRPGRNTRSISLRARMRNSGRVVQSD